MSEVIVWIIACDNLERQVSAPARMPVLLTQQRDGSSKLNTHMPPLLRRVYSSDEEKPDRPVWPPRSPYMEFDDSDYEHKKKDAKSELPRRRK